MLRNTNEKNIGILDVVLVYDGKEAYDLAVRQTRDYLSSFDGYNVALTSTNTTGDQECYPR